ncbi:MAG: helix-turn-helix transcriptional regulator [Porphyromonadaceae bacterium CG2_30_38_12]|nr:MAG: helix-turn-helix transcriptional regulator [Porphyromonadaceae bacterium CG2_30_38_12]
MRQIIIADNQDITNAGLRYILLNMGFKDEIELAQSKMELMTMLEKNNNPLVILDFALFDFQSTNELIIAANRYGNVDWVLFSEDLNDEFLTSVLYNTNNMSVLLKNNSSDEIQMAIKEALKGRRFICSYVSNILLDNSKKNVQQPTAIKLTTTEIEILREIALGKTTKEIANLRFVSSHTIMTHRKNIFRKLHVNTIHEATKYAMRAGLVDMAEYYI